MIPKSYITQWRERAPWPNDAQVEQDLVIERALVELFTDSFLKSKLAFRGGTALHKFYLKPQVRYSEDIDLVQISEGTSGEIIGRIRKRLAFLGKAKLKANKNMTTLKFRFESESAPVVSLRLKVEINCREHFVIYGYNEITHKIENGWFTGECGITSYEIEELLGTKLRALYQRKKGRDLFDLFYALTHLEVNVDKLINSFRMYMEKGGFIVPTQKEFSLNMDDKMNDPDFIGDIFALLRPGTNYDSKKAYALIKKEVLEKI